MRVSALVLALSIPPMLIACGSSSGSNSPASGDNTVRTGQITGLSVSGLHYHTATQSGLTTASGEFEYIAGEQIHFSLGGIEIGPTQAQTEIDLISELAGALPVTREALLEQLASLHDVTSFDRTINIATLLLALDADRNSDNGIELNDLHSRMSGSNVSLTFDMPMSKFLDNQPFRQIVAQFGKRIDLPYKAVIQAVYDSVNVQVATPRINRIRETYSDGRNKTSLLNFGSSLSRSACQHTRAGQLCSVDVDTDGVTSTIEESKLFTRDTDGTLIREEVFQGASTQTDPSILIRDIYTVDSARRVTQWEHQNLLLDEHSRETFSYTPFNQVEDVYFFNLNSNSPNSAEYTLTSIYNETTLYETERMEEFSDGTYRQFFERDERLARVLVDSDNDASFDDETHTYDYTPGNLDFRIAFDTNGDSVVDLEQSFSHDEEGHLSTYHGQRGELEERITDTFEQGRLVQSTRDLDDDGVIEWRFEYTYDSHGFITDRTQIRYEGGEEISRESVQIEHVLDPSPLEDGLAQILDPEYSFRVEPLIETCIVNQSQEAFCR